jgi:pyruvate/2-oxoglutarate dehydrogenase complex dihydrolipoamide acyltransferase (E2) component
MSTDPPELPDDEKPNRMEGAPAGVEGPLPPGAPQAIEEDEDLAEMSVADLRAEAELLGVTPTEGSGSGGRVVRADLEEALENAPPSPPAGRPSLQALAEQSAAQIPSREEE